MEALIQELEDDNLFGLTAPPQAVGWSELEIRQFFDSDGEEVPVASELQDKIAPAMDTNRVKPSLSREGDQLQPGHLVLEAFFKSKTFPKMLLAPSRS